MHPTFLILIAILFFNLNSAYIICPVYEEYTSCGSACPPSCQNQNSSICTAQCVRGCVCQKGYMREAPGGRCVPKSCENVPICKEDEKFATCASVCEQTCNDTKPKICPLICKTGCVCPEGYVREKEGGKCIPEVSCKTKCDENEIYKDCGSLCPESCSQPVRVCNRKCVQGCFCKEGYILDENSKQCIHTKNCPK